jgi:hypothetical protein
MRPEEIADVFSSYDTDFDWFSLRYSDAYTEGYCCLGLANGMSRIDDSVTVDDIVRCRDRPAAYFTPVLRPRPSISPRPGAASTFVHSVEVST